MTVPLSLFSLRVSGIAVPSFCIACRGKNKKLIIKQLSALAAMHCKAKNGKVNTVIVAEKKGRFIASYTK